MDSKPRKGRVAHGVYGKPILKLQLSARNMIDGTTTMNFKKSLIRSLIVINNHIAW